MLSTKELITRNLKHSLLEMHSTLTDTQIDDTVAIGASRGVGPLRALVDSGVPAAAIEAAVWRHSGWQQVRLIAEQIPGTLFDRLPIGMCRQRRVMPFSDDINGIVVAVADPTDISVLDDVRARVGDSVRFVVADPDELARVCNEIEFRSRTESFEVDDDDIDEVETKPEEENDGRIAQLVRGIVIRAAANRASDIHFEPSEKEMHIRFRIDGVLHHIASHPISVGPGLINRLKVMSNLDVSERRSPQDGRFAINSTETRLDLRLVTIPTIWDIECAVIRIIDRTKEIASLEALGYSPWILDTYDELCAHPHGMILMTGPTGSGKSTSLMATLKKIATPERKVLTVEDPVEIRFATVTQVQVNVKAGLTFARALRAFLRADPDIILVGEIRDKETANIAVESALTGHLVLASLHSNDAPSAAVRLLDMEIEPFLVSSSLRGVVSQRLARKLCGNCKERTPTPAGVFGGLEARVEIPSEIFRNRDGGCTQCSGTGYSGRIAVAEAMTVTEPIARAIADEKAGRDLMDIAVKEGMVTLRNDGLSKVLLGITSIVEVGRVAA